MKWTFDDIPDQTDRTVIVTGANAGLGFATAQALYRRGANVILACRNEARGTAALERILADGSSGSAQLCFLDLSSLQSVQEFADQFLAKHSKLDILVNNAGVMMPPETKTREGFELQIGVNYLGHFALTGRLLPALAATSGARVVTLSSLAHRGGKINVNTFQGAKSYKPWREYQQSKLACLMFALEMQKRLESKNIAVQSLSAHPGATKTELQRHNGLFHVLATAFGMPADQGALPTLYAATSTSARGGQFIGPSGLYEMRGYPKPAAIRSEARDERARAKLWDAAQQATGIAFLS